MSQTQMTVPAAPAARVPGAAVLGWTLMITAGVVVAVNAATPGHGDRWWANFILGPGALLAALGAPLLLRRGAAALAGYALACCGVLVFTVGALLRVAAMGDGWPLMIVLPTLAVAGTYAWRSDHPVGRGLHRTVAGLALTAALLGLAFLVGGGGLSLRWAGAFILLAGLVVGANGLELLRHRIDYRVPAATLLIGPALLAVLLGLRFLTGVLPS